MSTRQRRWQWPASSVPVGPSEPTFMSMRAGPSGTTFLRYHQSSLADRSAQPMTSSKVWIAMPTSPPTTVPLMRTN